MKRLLFTILALCVLCVGLQAQNTNTTNQKGVTSQGQLDTVRNTRVQDGPIQGNFVDQFGKAGQRPGLSPYGQRLKAVIKVTSSSINSVSGSTATIAATVSDSGDYALPIIERGVCYAITANPTLLTPTATKVTDDNISGKGFGNFNVSLSGLQPHTAYHARAYAVSLYDTVYGADLAFTTLLAGALSGKFTINANGDQVYFSQGNLQYQASTNTWRFAEHQWDYVGDDYKGNVYVGSEKSSNKSVSNSYSGWIDLFGWGTSGYNHGATCYQPYSTSSTDASYNPYGSLTSNLFDNNGQADWGYNAISNGGNTENSGWRTLKNDATHNEWQYIFDIRETGNTVNSTAHARYALAIINMTSLSNTTTGDKGIILFPDTYNGPAENVSGQITWGIINDKSSWVYGQVTCTKCTTEGWATLEAAGCVFLPAAGFRTGSSASYVDGTVDYWSSSYYSNSHAYSIHFISNSAVADYRFERYNGLSVRLVRNTELKGSLSYATPEVDKLSVDVAFTTPLTHVGDGTVTYARTDGDNICTVNATTGLVTLNGTAGTCTITATVTDASFYTYSTTTASYTLTVTEATALQTPLTLEAVANGTIKVNNPRTGMQYNVNNGVKTTMTETTTINVAAGDKVRFYGNGTNITSYYVDYYNLTMIADGTAQVKVYGNIMSLVDETSYATATTLTGDNNFRSLFDGNSTLTDASGLLLPVTTLTSNCYCSLFEGCSNLTTAPVNLPATSLAYRCYNRMFWNCSSLTTAPTTLSATTLADECCRMMFQNCSNLTTAPTLPATTLVNNCYLLMFDNCSKLNSVTCLATSGINTNYTYWWLNGVATSGTFTAANSTVSWSGGINGIPYGWTRINAVIDLSTVTTDTIVPNGWTVTGTLGVNKKISIANGATVKLDNVNINGSGTWTSGNYAGLNCLGDATIILADGTTNTVKGFDNHYPSIHVPSGSTLTIQGETAGTGTLNALKNNYSAGIGCGYNIGCGNITINSGTITATDGGYGTRGAGIGGCNNSSCGDITINGGTITAQGGSGGAGIGCGGFPGYTSSHCGNITINGGTVTAYAGSSGGAAGIGSAGDSSSSCGDITIMSTVTRVTATKGAGATNSIGKGNSSSTCGTVTIGGVTGAISTSPYTYPPQQ